MPFTRMDIDTVEGKEYARKWGEDIIFKKIALESVDTKKDIENLENQLKREPFLSVKLKQDGIKKGKWYSFDTKKTNFYGLCEYLGCPIEYEIFYDNWSGVIHSNSVYEENIHRGKSEKGMESIRSLNGYQSLITLLLFMIIELFENVFRNTDPDYYARFLRFAKNQYSILKAEIMKTEIKTEI